MANIRILELAKELKVTVATVQKLAAQCHIAVNSPTSMLTTEDRDKIIAAMKNVSNTRNQHGRGRKVTVTRHAAIASDHGGMNRSNRTSATVEVRRRHNRGSPPVNNKEPASIAVVKNKHDNKPKVIDPVTKVIDKVDTKIVNTNAKVDKADVVTKIAPKTVPVDSESSSNAAAKTNAPHETNVVKPSATQKGKVSVKVSEKNIATTAVATEVIKTLESRNAKPIARKDDKQRRQPEQQQRKQQTNTTARPQTQQKVGAQPQKQGQRQGQQRQNQRPGQRPAGQRPTGAPRSVLHRKGPSPAQIAAAKVPGSSVKAIEEDIKRERAEQRKQRAIQQRQARLQRQQRERQAAAANRPPRPAGATAGARPSNPRNNNSANRAGAQSRPPIQPQTPPPAVPPPASDQPKRKFGKKAKTQRLSPAQKAARREYDAKKHVALTPAEEERQARLRKSDKRRRGKHGNDDGVAFVARDISLYDKPIMISDLAHRMSIKASELVAKLFGMGVMANINASVDSETAQMLVEEFGHKVKLVSESAVEDALTDEVEQEESDLESRPPVVVVMGHVDHGKTSLLDTIRKSSVTSSEAGGITQHIGAYMVKMSDGDRVVFIDTPGHEAFTTLRARGAKITDVAVLVVAADDGVKPQTVEAIAHAKDAKVPIVVAINKMDKPDANSDLVLRQLAEHGLQPEDWGGETICVPVSAKTGEGVDNLLEMLALQTELLELQANPNARGRGKVIESQLEHGRGPVATILVQSGTFKRGDIVVAGDVMGRIRAIVDEHSVQHRTAGPSIPFEMLGLEAVPEAGEDVVAVESEKQARDIVAYRIRKRREEELANQQQLSVQDMFQQHKEKQEIIEAKVIIKGDVTGSVEALVSKLSGLGNDELRVRVIHKGVGAITEGDVMLASASNAIVVGFGVRPQTKAKSAAAREGVDVRFYTIIYEVLDDMRKLLSGMLAPEEFEEALGTLEVRQVFSVPKLGMIAGCFVQDGMVQRNAKARLLRDGRQIYEGALDSLRRFKDDVREVKKGYECGISILNYNDIKVGDTVEIFVIAERESKL
ncbi:MAG: translation initiation factor IF-2 [Mariprofundales bacterium]